MIIMTTKAACAFALATCSLNISSALASASTTISADTDLHHLRRRRRNYADRRKLLHNNVQSSPTSLGRTSRGGFCLDDASYRSKIGFTCKAIRQAGLNCDGFADLGFTQNETEELKISCPNACGRCTDAAAQSLSISTISPTPAPTRAPTGAPTTTPTLLLTNSDVGTCFDDNCADDFLYTGKYNIDCGVIRSGAFDCTKFGVMNYNDDEVTELISKCPCACNIGCEVSGAPSRMSTPPPTNKPTSAAPSAHPTSRPSTSPTAQPSGEPTIEPSSSPSMSESASPSTSPSSNPTTSHSNAPSRPPVSSAPSNSPTVSHTVAPSRVPSTPSPSATPSARHSYYPSLVPSAKVFTLKNPSLSPTFSPVSKPVPSNAEDALMSSGEAANGDMSTDFDNKVNDISPRSKTIGEKEKIDESGDNWGSVHPASVYEEEVMQTSGSTNKIGASVAIATSFALLNFMSAVLPDMLHIF